MTPLRKKMIDLMTFKKYSPKTQRSYLFAVTELSKSFHCSPEHIAEQAIKEWLIQTANERHWSESTIYMVTSGLKFIYRRVLERPDFFADMPLPKRAQKIPDLLTQQEVCAILNETTNLKHMTLLSLCYGCGLRVSEVVALTQDRIDSGHHLVLIRQAKGRKDRQVPLSDSLLYQLRVYWQQYRPKNYLFCSNRPGKRLSTSSAQKVFNRAKQAAGISKVGGIHSLRHAYATHQLEQGLPIHQLQRILGHQNINTTLRYLHWIPHRDSLAVDLVAQLPLVTRYRLFNRG